MQEIPEYHLYIGADHRGFQKKEELLPMLQDCHENVIVEDLGADEYDQADDFNDYALSVARAVLNRKYSLGILLCGSAHGVCMQANRIPGARAINAASVDSAQAGREHDHANILCLSADELDVNKMEEIIRAFCHTQPSQEERYLRRVKRLDDTAEIKNGITSCLPLEDDSTAGETDKGEEE